MLVPVLFCMSRFQGCALLTTPPTPTYFLWINPFSAIVEDDDEILLALAEALGQLVPAVGGPGHAALLLPR